jgi:hypothetical protein
MHDASGIGAMVEALEMPQFVDRLFCRAQEENHPVGFEAIELLPKTGRAMIATPAAGSASPKTN